ncbi:hypothetical protein CR513_21119, partial [Mucuna pruriens]
MIRSSSVTIQRWYDSFLAAQYWIILHINNVIKNDDTKAKCMLNIVKFKSWSCSWLNVMMKGFSFSSFEWSMEPKLCLNAL